MSRLQHLRGRLHKLASFGDLQGFARKCNELSYQLMQVGRASEAQAFLRIVAEAETLHNHLELVDRNVQALIQSLDAAEKKQEEAEDEAENSMQELWDRRVKEIYNTLLSETDQTRALAKAVDALQFGRPFVKLR